MSRNRMPRRRQRKLKRQLRDGLEEKQRKQAQWRKRRQQYDGVTTAHE